MDVHGEYIQSMALGEDGRLVKLVVVLVERFRLGLKAGTATGLCKNITGMAVPVFLSVSWLGGRSLPKPPIRCGSDG